MFIHIKFYFFATIIIISSYTIILSKEISKLKNENMFPYYDSRLELSLSKSSYSFESDEPISIKLIFQNGPKRIWLSTRMNFCYSDTCEIYCKIIGPGGKPPAHKLRIRAAGPAKSSDFKVLLPHESIKKELLISKYFNLNVSGLYSVTFFYKYDYKNMPKFDVNTYFISEVIKSNKIEFKIK
jgi:hypothetical protein